MKFRKRPVVIDAVCNDGKWPTVRDWMIALRDGGFAFDPGTAPPLVRNDDGSLNIFTREGTMRADVGDYVIRGIAGEFYPCKPDIFAATYEPVEIAEGVSA